MFAGCRLLAWLWIGPVLLGCSNSATVAQDTKKDRFAQDQVIEMPNPIAFDGERAMSYLRKLCDIGPRISGSDGMLRQQEILKEHFEKFGGTVSFQRFEVRQHSRPRPTRMANLIVTWFPERERRILLCGHYDTRPLADQEPDRRNWTKPFLSANDGTSTVAWMMEWAHHVKSMDLKVGLDFVLFDGEEYIFEPGRDEYFLGSKHFAAEYRRRPPPHRYIAGVLLDLFAGKNAVFPVEGNSLFHAGRLAEEIWRLAAQLEVKAFKWVQGPTVDDDHLALNAVGIPTIDIIDFDYPHWHKLTDLPENCSPDSMAAVSRVLSVWLQQIK